MSCVLGQLRHTGLVLQLKGDDLLLADRELAHLGDHLVHIVDHDVHRLTPAAHDAAGLEQGRGDRVREPVLQALRLADVLEAVAARALGDPQAVGALQAPHHPAHVQGRAAEARGRDVDADRGDVTDLDGLLLRREDEAQHIDEAGRDRLHADLLERVVPDERLAHAIEQLLLIERRVALAHDARDLVTSQAQRARERRLLRGQEVVHGRELQRRRELVADEVGGRADAVHEVREGARAQRPGLVVPRERRERELVAHRDHAPLAEIHDGQVARAAVALVRVEDDLGGGVERRVEVAPQREHVGGRPQRARDARRDRAGNVGVHVHVALAKGGRARRRRTAPRP